VALINTAGNVGSYPLAGRNAGIAARTPEEKTWPEDSVPSIYRAPNANIQSPGHQGLDLVEFKLNGELLSHLLGKKSDEGGGPLFGPEESAILQQCCVRGGSLRDAAELLTQHRKPSEGGASQARINGVIARQLRPSTHGLLLIYPIVPTDGRWPEDEKPFMGLAFSFPSSHTARAVDYRVNRVWQDTFQDDDYGDSD